MSGFNMKVLLNYCSKFKRKCIVQYGGFRHQITNELSNSSDFYYFDNMLQLTDEVTSSLINYNV